MPLGDINTQMSSGVNQISPHPIRCAYRGHFSPNFFFFLNWWNFAHFRLKFLLISFLKFKGKTSKMAFSKILSRIRSVAFFQKIDRIFRSDLIVLTKDRVGSIFFWNFEVESGRTPTRVLFRQVKISNPVVLTTCSWFLEQILSSKIY